MKYLKSYDNYILNDNYSLDLLLESNKFNFYRILHEKTVSKLGLNLYFVGTFQMGITVLYPVIEALTKNTPVPTQITPEQIVLLTIFSIAQILHVVNDDVQKIKKELQDNNLMDVATKVNKSIKSIYKIFSFVARSFGKVVDVFTEMIGYVSLCIPVYFAILEMISKDGLNLDTLPQKVLVLTGGAAIFAFKSLIETIVDFVKNKFRK
jgi:hypothetical protein